MDKIKVSKEKLLKELHTNREVHITEYNEMYNEYQKAVIKKLQLLTRNAKKAPEFATIDTVVGLSAPISNETDYDTAIEMLQFSVEDEIFITQREFQRYVQNKWDWSDRFEYSKSLYLGE